MDAINRLETKVDKLAEALQELIVLNERQMQQQDKINQQEQDIKSIKDRQIELEMKVNTWIQRGIGAWAVIAAAYAIARTFIH